MISPEYKTKGCKVSECVILVILVFLSPAIRVSAFSSVVTDTTKRSVKLTPVVLSCLPPLTLAEKNNAAQDFKTNNDDSSLTRRSLLAQIFTTVALVSSSDVCYAAKSSNIDPETAYRNLRKAREELVYAGRTYFPKRDWEGLREYLSDEDSCLNNYDANANALLTSKRLDTESKQAIGTIRRYGVGADVIIMYGGLKAELSEDNERPNPAEIEKYYIKTLDSIEEVIAIVRSNPGFKQIE